MESVYLVMHELAILRDLEKAYKGVVRGATEYAMENNAIELSKAT